MEIFVAPMDAPLTPTATALGAAHFFLAATTTAAFVTLIFAYRRRAILRRFVLSYCAAFVHQARGSPKGVLHTNRGGYIGQRVQIVISRSDLIRSDMQI